MPENTALAKPAVPVLGECGVIRDGIFQAQPAEPAVGQIQMDFFAKPALGADAEAVTDDQHPDHQLRINGWPASVAVVFGEVLVEIAKIEILVDAAKEVILGNVVVKIEGKAGHSLMIAKALTASYRGHCIHWNITPASVPALPQCWQE